MVQGLQPPGSAGGHTFRRHRGPGAHPPIHGLCPVGRPARLLRPLRRVSAAHGGRPVRQQHAAGHRAGGGGFANDQRLPGASGHCRQRGLHRLRRVSGAGGGAVPVSSGGASPGAGGEFPFPPGGKRLYQRGGHNHRLQPAVQDVRGLRGQGGPPLRDHMAGFRGRLSLYPLALPGHGGGGLCLHVRPEAFESPYTLCPGRGGGDHPDLLGDGVQSRHQGAAFGGDG